MTTNYLLDSWGGDLTVSLTSEEIDFSADSETLLAAAKRVSARHEELSLEALQLWLVFWSNDQMISRTILGSTVAAGDASFAAYHQRLSALLDTSSCAVHVTALASLGGFPLWRSLSKLLGPIVERDGPIRESSLSLFVGTDTTISSVFLGDRFSKRQLDEEPQLLLGAIEGRFILDVDGESRVVSEGEWIYVPRKVARSVRFEELGVMFCLAASESLSATKDLKLITKAAVSFCRNLTDDKIEHEIVRIDQPISGPPASFAKAFESAKIFSDTLITQVAQEWFKQQISLGFVSTPPRDQALSLDECEHVVIAGGAAIRWCTAPNLLLIDLSGRTMQIAAAPAIEQAIETLNQGKPVCVQQMVEAAADENDLDEVVYELLQNLLSFHVIEDATKST